jgi:hypothetical protein
MDIASLIKQSDVYARARFTTNDATFAEGRVDHAGGKVRGTERYGLDRATYRMEQSRRHTGGARLTDMLTKSGIYTRFMTLAGLARAALLSGIALRRR